MKIILALAIISWLVFPISRLWADGTIYTFSESFDTIDHKGPDNTADWNSANGVLQLPANTDPGSNTKQINGSVTVMGDYLYYAWIDFRGGIGNNNGHIYLQRYSKSGANPLAADVQVDHGSGISDGFFATYVKMINDGTYVYIFWTNGSSLYLQKLNANAETQWASDLQVNAPTVAVNNYNYGYFSGIVNSDQSLSFFWNSGAGVYLQKVKIDPADGTGARDGDSIRLLGSSANPVYVNLSTASRDSADNYYLIYSSYNKTNANTELFLDKYNSSGTAAWGNRVTIAVVQSIYGADIVTDASGNSYIVWDQRNSGSGSDAYITAVNSSGATISGWTAKKVYTDTSYYNQTNPRVRLDSNNAPNVIWSDTRTSSKLDVYAQRYNTSGAAQWPAAGIKVNTGDNPSANAGYYTGYNANFVVDTAGANNSLYVAWYAYRSADFDVFGQKVTSAGIANASDWTITQTEAGGGYALSAEGVSDDVLYPDNPTSPILSAKAYCNYYSRGQTIQLFLSNDGTTWQSASLNGTSLSFSNTNGKSLYWKAVISTTDLFITPVIYNILIEYTMAGEVSPYQKILYIYDDYWHYPASGWMNYTAMAMDSFSHDNPATGSSCVKITYDPAKASWAGFYAQASAQWGGEGIDLSNYSAMLIRAKAGDENASAIQVQFGVGGDSGDTCSVKTNFMVLTNEWQTYAIDLTNKNLTNINGLLLVVMRPAVNIDPSFYIDDIKFIGPGPAKITDLNATLGSTPGSTNLTWTAPAGDYTNTAYVVKYSANYMYNQIDFNNATAYGQSWIPGTPGSAESHAVTGLTPGQGYYFAVQTTDDQGNMSDLSNILYVIARTAGIGITVDGTVDLGLMTAGETKIAADPVTVTNIGGVPVTLTLNLINPPGWAAAPVPGMNQYALLGAFGSTSGAVIWNVNNHLLTDQGIKCTNAVYAGDQNGVGVAVNDQRKLWLRLTAPIGIDIGTERQIITISVTAGTVN